MNKLRLNDWKTNTVIGKDHQSVLGNEKDNVHSITFYNGKEFSFHRKLKKSLECDNYFEPPHCSQERGLNENHSGLIRQYLQKGIAFDKMKRNTRL